MRLRLDRCSHDLHFASKASPANDLEHLILGVLARRHLSCVGPGLPLACICCEVALFALCECEIVPCFSICMMVASMFKCIHESLPIQVCWQKVLPASNYHSLLVPRGVGPDEVMLRLEVETLTPGEAADFKPDGNSSVSGKLDRK